MKIRSKAAVGEETEALPLCVQLLVILVIYTHFSNELAVVAAVITRSTLSALPDQTAFSLKVLSPERENATADTCPAKTHCSSQLVTGANTPFDDR